ncbi:HTH-type transcriptional regulator BetI (plasmid) [Pseudoseohaeicola sp. NH-UV-7]|uniref:TetR/AcrR family transcriptional regulator n=1 Tax=unclassified Sulfitobacter TaxID=196795 RepID=UPI000E0C3AE4|nr:TetR/AcrR family transcriptional regulator [Sulfitobacter sp. JL08]AXI53675.1 TetR family transcriptional regulator [Sulfitobacter sp. JL08]
MARTIAKDYDAKRGHILKTAARVFAKEGVARASMNHVARECGISKANIYHYYSSKDALLFDILDSYLSALRDRICNLPLSGLPAREKLHRIVEQTLLAYDGMDHEHKIQTEGLPLLPQEQQSVLRGYQRDMVRQLGDVLAEIEPDVFRNDPVKLRATTMSVFGMLNWFYMWNPRADSQARQDYARLVTTLACDGLRGL